MVFCSEHRRPLTHGYFHLACATVFTTAQSTPYKTNVFSATFSGPVEVQQSGSKGGTSTNVIYLTNGAVSQVLGVRTINAPGIDVNRTSLDVYAENALKGKTQDDRQYYEVQGHIAVYLNTHYTDKGVVLRRRRLTIILNARTVIMLVQDAEASFSDGGVEDWQTLTHSLVINNACTLPEGCS